MFRRPKSENAGVAVGHSGGVRRAAAFAAAPQYLKVTVLLGHRGSIIPGIDPYMTFREFKGFLSNLFFAGRAEPWELELRDFRGRVVSKDDSEVLSKYIRYGDSIILARKMGGAAAFFDSGDSFQGVSFRADFVDTSNTIEPWQSFHAPHLRPDVAVHTTEKQQAWRPPQHAGGHSSLLKGNTIPTKFDHIVTSEPEPPKPLTRFGTVIARGTCSQYNASDVSVGSSACTSVCLAAAKYLLVDYAFEDPSSLLPCVLDEITRCGVDLYRSASTHSSIDDLWSLPQYETICEALHRDPDLPPHQQLASQAGFEAVMESCLSQLGLHEDAPPTSHPLPARVAIILTKPPETILLLHVRESQGWYMMDSHGESFSDHPVTYLMCFDSASSLASALVAKFPTLPDVCGDVPYNRFEATPLVAAAVKSGSSESRRGTEPPWGLPSVAPSAPPEVLLKTTDGAQKMLSFFGRKKDITSEKVPDSAKSFDANIARSFSATFARGDDDVSEKPPSYAAMRSRSVKKGSFGSDGTREADEGEKKPPSAPLHEAHREREDETLERASSTQQLASAKSKDHASFHLSRIMDMTMFVDPIFGQVMADPVVCSDGKTYDRPVIEAHFRRRVEAEEERMWQEEAARTGSEEQSHSDNNASCCRGPRPAVKLTSPTTNEEVDGDLTPNEMVERLIVQLMETNAFCLDEEDVADWNRRRDEKKVRDSERQEIERHDREEEERMRRAAEEAEANRAAEEHGTDDTTKPCDRVRVLRRIDQDNSNRLSDDDIGLAVHLCDESSERVPLQYAQALTGELRCMVASCARRLTNSSHASLQWCSRCGRLVCGSCLAFQVSIYQSLGAERLYRICGECVMHLVDVLDPQGACGQLRAFLVRVPLTRYTSELSRQAVEIQDGLAKRAADQEFGPEVVQLQDQITKLEQARQEVDREIAEAKAKAQAAQRDDGRTKSTTATGSQSMQEMEAEIEKLTVELQTLQEADVDLSNEEETIAHVQNREDVAMRLDSLQMAFVEEQSRLVSVPNPEANTNASVEKLEEICRDVETQCSQLMEAGMPDDEEEQVAFILRTSALQAELEEASTKLAMAQSQTDVESLRREHETLAEEIQLLEGEDFEAAFSKLSQMEGLLNGERVVGQSELEVQANSQQEGPLDANRIDAIGKWDDLRPLPLALVYPTQRMTNEVELLKNTLSQHLPQSQRKYENQYADRRRALRITIDALEDEIDQKRAEAQNAATSAEEEQRKLEARRARHAQEERERQERERQRLEAERRAREEAESLRRRHQADEDATRRAFAATAGVSGAAAAFGGTGDLRMCKRCKAGPVENMACSDLAAHNNNSTEYKGRTVARSRSPNACPNCGWYDSHWHNWPIWDNIYGPH